MVKRKLLIGIVTPSRERIDKAKKQLASFMSNAEDKDLVKFYYYIDEDDRKCMEYKDFAESEGALLLIGRPGSVSEGFNKLAFQAMADGCDIILMGNDDAHCGTRRWDTILENIFLKMGQSPLCVLLGGNSREKFAFPAVSKQWIASVGHYSPGIFKFFFHDTWIYEISKMAGCIEHADELKINHMHAAKQINALKRDATHYKNNGRTFHRLLNRFFGIKIGNWGNMSEDADTFNRTYTLRVEAAQRIINRRDLQNTHQYGQS